ncbi:hypothetical protein C8R45DRAFT_1209348 [Mycena sanguinolenta]|nr:hypothetical protein C8R45DRAFT_1209348 [Mycena sanguinolenta]
MSQCSECGAFVGLNAREFNLNNITISPRTLARISQLSTTNEPPQEPESTILRPIAQKTAAQSACLDAEISRLQGQLMEMKEERGALAEYHAQNTTILSPLRRMPSEVLGEIFRGPPGRAVAISKSALWSKIHLYLTFKTQYLSAMIRTQIERARTLGIAFHASCDHDTRPQVDMFQVLPGEFVQLGRTPSPLDRRPAPTDDSLSGTPSGSTKGSSGVGWSGQPDKRPVSEFLQDGGVFNRHQHLQPISLLAHPSPVHYQLTQYDFDAPWATHYALLRSLPNLHEARIIRDFDWTLAWPEPGVRLTRLRRLYISDPEILDYLATPVLERMVVIDSIETSLHLEAFLTRSSCPLRRLCIAGLPDLPSLLIILEQSPSITELAMIVRGTDANDEDIERDVFTTFLTHFTISDSTGILPHISRLDLACKKVDTIPYPLYLDMLDSRWNVRNCALKAAELLLPNAAVFPDPQFLARMETLRQDGLQNSFSSGKPALRRANEWLNIPSWD